MANLALIFLVFFVVVQVTLAASRFPREEPAADTSAIDPAKSITDLLNNFKKSVDNALTKENVDNALGSLSQMGNQLKQLGQEWADKVIKNNKQTQ